MDDLISRQAAIDALERERTYSAAYKYGYTQADYFKQYNMGLTDGIKALNKLPSAQPEQIARDIATIIENEQDMRVILQNERTETHSCECQRTETHESCTDCPLYDHDRHNCPRFNRVIPATIEAAKPRWIPVTERQPEYGVEVLTINTDGDYEINHIIDEEDAEWFFDGVIAWCELPEPYEEGQE